MSVIQFDEPWAVRLMPMNVDLKLAKEVGEVCPLIAVEGNKGLVIRDREMFWWPLERMRVILQPEAQPAETPERVPQDLAGEESQT